MARSNNKDWFDIPLSDCFDVFAFVMEKTIAKYNFQFHAFVLMNNHFHMMIGTPYSNISEGMRYFMTESSRGLRVKALRINHVYGGRYKPCLVMSPSYYAYCLKYIYRNPIKANIVSRVEDYPWSTISRYSHSIQNLVAPISTGHDVYLSDKQANNLRWFNESLSIVQESQLGLALRRSVLEFKPDRNKRKKIVFDEQSITRVTRKK